MRGCFPSSSLPQKQIPRRAKLSGAGPWQPKTLGTSQVISSSISPDKISQLTNLVPDRPTDEVKKIAPKGGQVSGGTSSENSGASSGGTSSSGSSGSSDVSLIPGLAVFRVFTYNSSLRRSHPRNVMLMAPLPKGVLRRRRPVRRVEALES